MKLSYKKTFLAGFAFMTITAFWQFYDQVIPSLLEYSFGLNTIETNAIMSIDNILAIIMLPLFGALSDRVKSPLGRRTPFVLAGTLIAVAMLGIMPFSQKTGNLAIFLTCLFVLLTAMSIYRSPAVALMPDITPKPLRSKANAVINLMGALGGVFSLAMMMFLLKSEKSADGSSFYGKEQSFVPIFFVVGGFMLFGVILLLLTVRENKWAVKDEDGRKEETVHKDGKLEKSVLKSLIFILLSVFLWYMAYNAVTTAFSRYCIKVLGADLSTSSGYLMVATVIATLSYLPLGLLSSKTGRKNMILAGVVLMTVAYGGAFFITSPTPVMYVLFGLVGIGWAAINVNSFPMVVELAKMGDTGKYTGYYYTFSMAAQIITPYLSALLITYLPYNYRILFPYAVVFSALAFVTMLFVRHGDIKADKKDSALEYFDSGD